MAGKEGAPVAQKDKPGLDEKVLSLGRKTNKITMPVYGVVGVGALALGAPGVAALALMGASGDYITGEVMEDHRRSREQARLAKKTEKSGPFAKAIDVFVPTSSKVKK